MFSSILWQTSCNQFGILPKPANLPQPITMSTTSLSKRVLSHFKSDFDCSHALRTLSEACGGDCYLVGGAIRDVAFGVAGCGDLDLVVPNGDSRVYEALKVLGVPFELNSHGNPRYRWNRLQLDIFEPRNFFIGFPNVEAALSFFDLKINALAIHLGSGSLLDPIDGLSCLNQRRVGINWTRWQAMPAEEIMILLIRLVRVLYDIRALRLETQDVNTLVRNVIPKVVELDWNNFKHRFPPGKKEFFALLYPAITGHWKDYSKAEPTWCLEKRAKPMLGNSHGPDEATHKTLRSINYS